MCFFADKSLEHTMYSVSGFEHPNATNLLNFLQSGKTAAILSSSISVAVAGEGGGHWGYREGNGPENWPKTCQDGFRQVCKRLV